MTPLKVTGAPDTDTIDDILIWREWREREAINAARTSATDADQAAITSNVTAFVTRKTSRFIEMEQEQDQYPERPLAFRGILVAVPLSLLLWWFIWSAL